MRARLTTSILALFLLLVGGAGLYAGISRYQLGNASTNWPDTEGAITRSRVERITNVNRSSGRTRVDGYRYSADIRYSYRVDGVDYESDQLLFGDPPGGENEAGEVEVAAVMQRYPMGATVPVYYDPLRPQRAVLQPGTTLSDLFWPLLMGGLAAIAGLGLLGYLVVRWRDL